MKFKPPFSSAPFATPRARTLAIDVGGTTLKASVLNARRETVADRVSIDTPYPCPPKVLVNALVRLVKPHPGYDRVSVGFPGKVRGNKVITARRFRDEISRGFDLATAIETKLHRSMRLLNAPDTKGLAEIKDIGLESVVTLRTGVGIGLFRKSELVPHLELAHHPVYPYKNNADVGKKALKKVGKKKWNRRVQRVNRVFHALLQFDQIYLGGGNSRNITFELPAQARVIASEDGILGGFLLWAPLRRSPSNGGASRRAPGGDPTSRARRKARGGPAIV